MSAHDISQITNRRNLITSCASGAVEWTVNEFDGGNAMLTAEGSGGTRFSAHFNAGQWAEFQTLVAGGQS